ncbi:hypothetical protein J4558_23415 [Leptolyngbya sp. 15MV]|nr:hypothetical protein J4558_23415 [Leptolyngbya sp. 15MV]
MLGLTAIMVSASAIAMHQPCGLACAHACASQWPVARVLTAAGLGVDAAPSSASGRLWVGRIVMGGVEGGASGSVHAERYGAADQAGTRVMVEVEGLFAFQKSVVAVIDPWQPQNDRSGRRNPYTNPFTNAHDALGDRLEAARQQWLKDNGYVGGVRTFVNDAALVGKPKAEADASKSGERIEPRATIQVSPEAVRPARPFRVDAGPSTMGPVIRVSVPAHAAGIARQIAAASTQPEKVADARQ